MFSSLLGESRIVSFLILPLSSYALGVVTDLSRLAKQTNLNTLLSSRRAELQAIELHSSPSSSSLPPSFPPIGYSPLDPLGYGIGNGRLSNDEGRLVAYSDSDVEMGNGRDEHNPRYRRHQSLSAIDELEEEEGMEEDVFGGGSRSYPVQQQHQYGWNGLGVGGVEGVRDVYD